jgi:excisionase family DNA binding protein
MLDNMAQDNVGMRSQGKCYLNTDEAAAFLGRTPKAVCRMVERGQIPYRKWGKRLVFVREELEEFVNSLPDMRPADERKRWGNR